MNILHTVEFYDPSVGGMQEVVKQLSERLVKMGHTVTVATTKLPERTCGEINGVQIKEFNVSGNAVRGMRGDTQAFQDFLLSSKFDVVTNFAAQSWPTDLALPILKSINGKHFFVPTGFAALFQPKYQIYYERMKVWLKDYDMNVFLSNDYQDISFARSNNIQHCIVIPNGAGEDEFLREKYSDTRNKLSVPKDHLFILSVGSHTGKKGHKDTMIIFKKAKLKKTSLVIVGNHFGLFGCSFSCHFRSYFFAKSPMRFFDKKKIIITELTRPETVSAYKNADIFLFPSAIECSPIVLFECMASKTPFMVSDVGNAKEIIEWSGSGMLLPTRSKSVHGLTSVDTKLSSILLAVLANDLVKREQMAEKAFCIWKEKFSWEEIAKKYENLYQKIILEKYDHC